MRRPSPSKPDLEPRTIVPAHALGVETRAALANTNRHVDNGIDGSPRCESDVERRHALRHSGKGALRRVKRIDDGGDFDESRFVVRVENRQIELGVAGVAMSAA